MAVSMGQAGSTALEALSPNRSIRLKCALLLNWSPNATPTCCVGSREFSVCSCGWQSPRLPDIARELRNLYKL